MEKLNLGCGLNLLPGYTNVDKFGTPDMLCDLEAFPWPWPDNSVDEIILHHVLEHLGQTVDNYLSIIKEMYRICKPSTEVHITVPHPWHDDFINDPTHVRPITPDNMSLFSKKLNRLWAENGAANSPLGVYLNVDFEIKHVDFALDEPWASRVQSGELPEHELPQVARRYNNVIKQTKITLVAVK